MIPWQADNHAYHDDEDNTPSTTVGKKDRIFHIDGPGYVDKARTADYDYRAFIVDFRERVEVKIYGHWYQCSDFYKWHSQLYTTIKDVNDMTRDVVAKQKLGANWITVPANP